MVTITILNDIRGRIDGDFDSASLDDHLSFFKSKFWWNSAAAKRGLWDGKTHLFNRKSGTFPLGLLGTIKLWLKDRGDGYKVLDERTTAPISPLVIPATLGGGITLRPDQLDAIGKALARERGIIHGSTGSGKTELAIAMVEALGRPTTLFVTGRRSLARQTRERFAVRLGEPVSNIGFIGEGKWEESPLGIYIAIVDTLVSQKNTAKRSELYKRCKLLFVDEAHHAGSTTWYRTLMYCKSRYRYGLTGTPVGRSDSGDLYLRACTGGIVARIRSRDLIRDGILAKPSIFFTKIRRPVLADVGMDWATVYRRGIVDNRKRNKVILTYARELQRLEKKTLILVRELAHGYELSEHLSSCEFVNGSLDPDDIDRAKKRLQAGEIKTLIATSIFDEGIDLPEVNALIMAAGGKSIITTLQRIGRGLRKKLEDNRLFVFDFFDTTSDYLRDHSKRRVAICRKEGFDVKILKMAGHVGELVA